MNGRGATSTGQMPTSLHLHRAFDLHCVLWPGHSVRSPSESLMDCSKIIQLDFGQTPAQVHELIGGPRAVGCQPNAPNDCTWIYGTSGTVPNLGFRDEMSID